MNASHNRTYITSGSDVYDRDRAWQFCESQHSTGLVTWDTEEKYRDIKYIVNKDGENSMRSHTAIYNLDKNFCNTTITCDGKLVSCAKIEKYPH